MTPETELLINVFMAGVIVGGIIGFLATIAGVSSAFKRHK